MKKIFSLLILGSAIVAAVPVEDQVKSLPNMTTFDFPLYSGYLKVENTQKSLHYIFAQS